MPAQPKPPGQRRRRNVGQSQWVQLSVEGGRDEIPSLPGRRWLKSTRVWWVTVWRSPMAAVWQDADVDSLVRLARLRDDFWRGDLPVSALGAIQQLEDRFGLSPKSRRALQWEISSESVDRGSEGPKALRSLRAVEAF